MEAQEVFDKVVTHLRTQGCQSLDFDKGCMYRGPNDTKCAVGCLISDKEYDPAMEQTNVWSLRDFFSLSIETKDLLIKHTDLLSSLQAAHDNRDSWIKNPINQIFENLELNFSLIASKLNLIYTPPK